jgi:hypothetical protein
MQTVQISGKLWSGALSAKEVLFESVSAAHLDHGRLLLLRALSCFLPSATLLIDSVLLLYQLLSIRSQTPTFLLKVIHPGKVNRSRK